MKRVSIVIVNYNGKEWLKICLATLRNITYKTVEIIVVDNASSDESVSYLHKNFPKVIIIESSTNVGFAQANNLGVARATGEYVLLLNNDTKVAPDFLNHMVVAMDKDESIGVVQSAIFLLEDSKRFDSIGAFFTWTGFLYHFGYNQMYEKMYDKQLFLYTAKGACMLIRKKIIDEIGLFHPEYFAYFEETDFCHRVWLSGYKVVYEPRAVIWHKMGATSNSLPQANVQFHSYKNRIHSYSVNLGAIKLLQTLPIHIVLCLAISMGYILKRQPQVGMAVLQAVWWNILRIRKTSCERKKIQSYRIISDQRFLKRQSVVPPFWYFISLLVDSLKTYKEPFILRKSILNKAKYIKNL